MFFQEKGGKLPTNEHRHTLSLRERHQLFPALPLEHPLIRCFRPLYPPFVKRSPLAIHGEPPSCANFHLARKPPQLTRKPPAQERECTRRLAD
jgi:hypothetical protein